MILNPEKGENLARATRRWLRQIEPHRMHRLKLKPAKAALLVIDLQNFFLDPKSPTYTAGGAAILPNVQKLIAAFRRAKRPIIYTTHVHKPDGSDAGIMKWWWEGMCREGYPEARVHASIAPRPADKIIVKHRYSAFYNTDLETVLRCAKIEDLVITGIMTNLCCESTARDAYYRDYRVFFLADATGSTAEELHMATLMNLAYGFSHIATTAEILKSIASSPNARAGKTGATGLA
ncbi:MAG TPA: isochorismatase family cysteine hydrolase [bacterium]|jgi:ureidoacrylate peracid hydrolase